MSTVKTNNVQVGQSVTATNNFTLYQPSTPDGTVRLGVGNTGATTLDVVTATSAGNVTVSGTLTATALAGNGTGITGIGTTVNIQTFNAGDADLTWDKPTGGQTMCRIQVWAGGGGGARSATVNSNGGGGGGAYAEITVPLSYMAATATITIGAAGTGRTGSTGTGTAGGNSSVPINNYETTSNLKTIIAYGGGGGGTSIGGGGGGLLGAGVTGTTGYGGLGYAGAAGQTTTPVGAATSGTAYPYANQTNPDPTAGGFGKNAGFSVGCPPVTATVPGAGGSIFGGGGGAYGLSAAANNGGSSLWGGGGGCSAGTAGQSLYGGNGGVNAVGVVPAGGGGSSNTVNTNGSNGAAGRVIVTSW